MFPVLLKRLVQAVLAVFMVSAVFAPGAWGQADVHGQWSTLPYLMPTNAVHAALLYNGKVLVIAGSVSTAGTQSLTAALWDPQAGAITTQSTTWYMFCNGMTALADGRILVAGGTIQSNPFLGSPKAAIYDPATNAFTDVQSMAHGRWYPNVTLLSDGRVMAFSGFNETTGATNNTVEIYTVGTGWSSQYTAPFTPPLYPRMHLLPNGKVFFSGSTPTSYLFNPVGNTWSTVANTKSGINRVYGSSVLLPLTPANNYDPRVIILGGGQPSATPTTEIIDLGAGSPSWVYGPDMTQARVEMDAVLLPTGKVLALAGSSSDEDASTASLNADLYDPAANSFSSAGANAYPRMYHTIALLMPDATVWLAGSNPSTGVYEQHMEIYQPAYLFTRDANNNVIKATQPTITSVPSTINWGGQFTVTTPDAANITSAVLMKPGSSTHAFDLDARQVGLNFTAGSGTLTVTGPPNANIAPPGYYMLFLINNHGVPSVAKFLLLSGSGAPPPPPPPTGINLAQSNSVPTTLKPSVTTLAAPFTATQTAGNLNVVAVGWGDVASSVSTVTDSLGNKYSPAGGTTTGSGLRQAIYYAKNIAPGSNTVTVTFNKAAAYPDMRILEYSGLDPSNPLDATAAGVGTGTTAASASATTTAANELIFGAGNNGDGFSGAGAGFTLRMIDYYGNLAEDKAVGGSGSYGVSAPLKKSTNWVMQMATFRASGQGSANPAPTVSGVSPSSGTTAGATAVTISGTGFLAGATVTFGGTSATSVNVASSTSMTATTPAHTVGAVNVVVTNSDSQSGPLSDGFTYTTPTNPAPTVSGVSPSSGTTAGGTPVTITGTGFLAGATVTFGGTAATGVTVVSSTSITATTPAHTAGAVNVVVTNTDAQSGPLSNGFMYKNPAPTVTGISPTSGTTTGGTPVTITGTGFLAGATVTFGTTAATGVTVVSSTSITATTPAQTVGAVNVVVTNTDGQSGPLTNGYTYTTSSGGGRIAFVQSTSGPNTLQHSLSSIGATLSLAQTAGDLNVVVVGWGDVTSLVSTVTDSLGNVYNQAGGTATGSGLRQAIFFAKNIAAGTNTVTVTFNQAATYPDIRILEYSGLDPNNPLDVTSAAVGSGTTADSGLATTSFANDLIFGAGNNGDGFKGAGTGFTLRMIDYYGNLAEDESVTSTGSYKATASLQKSTTWVMQMVAFRQNVN